MALAPGQPRASRRATLKKLNSTIIQILLLYITDKWSYYMRRKKGRQFYSLFLSGFSNANLYLLSLSSVFQYIQLHLVRDNGDYKVENVYRWGLGGYVGGMGGFLSETGLA